MKKLLSLILVLVMILSLAACGDKTETNDETTVDDIPATEESTFADIEADSLEELEESEYVDKDTTTKKETTTKETENETNSSSGNLDPDFKAAMDSYEDFMDEYVDFMKKYKANPTDITLLADYADYMSDYTDFVEDFEAWEDEDLNADELAYYLEVQTRVSKKLLEAAE